MSYCFDTSVLITAWRRNYPRDVFSTLWENLEEMIEHGEIVAPWEVRVELESKDDEILAWARERDYMFIPVDEDIQVRVATILSLFPGLLDTKLNRSGADPFVIALAQARNLTVVTYERKSNNREKPKIPDVCEGLQDYKVDWMHFLPFMQNQGWSF